MYCVKEQLIADVIDRLRERGYPIRILNQLVVLMRSGEVVGNPKKRHLLALRLGIDPDDKDFNDVFRSGD